MEGTSSALEHDNILLCTEDREFLYSGEGASLAAGFNPSFVGQASAEEVFQEPQPKMAAIEPNMESQEDEYSPEPSNAGEPSRKTRRRNTLRDRLRSEAEQSAYKRLREIVPTLQDQKKQTKLDTIRQTCEYIEYLNKLKAEKEKAQKQGETPNVSQAPGAQINTQ